MQNTSKVEIEIHIRFGDVDVQKKSAYVGVLG